MYFSPPVFVKGTGMSLTRYLKKWLEMEWLFGYVRFIRNYRQDTGNKRDKRLGRSF